MLRKLHIENYALIDRMDLDFDEGFTVITGETGAGKSILMGALALILGQRADSKALKEGADKCVTEATFDIRSYGLESHFIENDLEFDPDVCLIRRELYANGKSRAFVNDSPVSLGVLKALSERLIDIHSQHQNLLLSTDDFQLEVVDSVAESHNELAAYQSHYTHYKQCQSRLHRLEEEAAKSREQEEYLRFQFDQLDAANLQEGEQEALEAEWTTLTHAEDIRQGIGRIFQWLDDEERGVVLSLKQALTQAEQLRPLYAKIHDAEERLQSCHLDLKDLSRELEVLLNDIEVNPSRMNWIDERLNLLYSLQQKHRVSDTIALLELKSNLQQQLSLIDSSEEALSHCRQALNDAEKAVHEAAAVLTGKRASVSSFMETHLQQQLVELGMPKARFQVLLEAKNPDSDGADRVSFLFSANSSVAPQPIHRIASGGEMSRIMLCIKALIAEKKALPTLIFDEIDTGVSGEIAHRMGRIMKRMADRRQVLCITHLPQIAAKGSHHFKVLKTDRSGITTTSVQPLSPEERLHEVALLLSGANLTEAAITNAKQLMLETH
jgi:DNA repair protein RecN (Recombination protein N)